MSWNIQHNQSAGIIEVSFAGRVTGPDLRAATGRRISLQKETGTTQVLADASEVDVAPSVLDLYGLPNKLYIELEASRQSRIALVLPKSEEPKESAKFLQTVARNHGWQIQIFMDRQSAVTWLAQQTSPNQAIARDKE